MTGTLTLFAAAHHKLVKIGGAVVHRLHCDDGNRTVAGKSERQQRRSDLHLIINRSLGEKIVRWGFPLQLQGCPTWYCVYILLRCFSKPQLMRLIVVKTRIKLYFLSHNTGFDACGSLLWVESREMRLQRKRRKIILKITQFVLKTSSIEALIIIIIIIY